MRYFAFTAFAFLLLCASSSQGQMRFQGGNRGGFTSKDPSQAFEEQAKGRGFFLVSESKSPFLAGYLKEQGITTDKITKDMYLKYVEHRTKMFSSGQFKFGGGGPPSGTPGAPTTPPAPGAAPAPTSVNPAEAMNLWMDSEFKRRDQNGDGKLNKDEASDSLRSNWDRWDANKDGLIDFAEFKEYASARMQSRDEAQKPVNPVIIVVEEELDRRPVVFRAGKLPKELPKWFTDIAGEDAQISLYEWRMNLKAISKTLDEFAEWDLNDDGFITPEEVLRKMNVIGSAPVATAGAGTNPTVIRGGESQDRRGPGGGSGFGGFGKKRP